jgi:hypothetical protein
VFLERATIGLGSAFLRLGARLNFHRMYEEAIAGFEEEAVARRQAGALEAVGLGGSEGEIDPPKFSAVGLPRR